MFLKDAQTFLLFQAHFKDESDTVTVFNEDEFNDDENLEADDDDEDYKIEGWVISSCLEKIVFSLSKQWK